MANGLIPLATRHSPLATTNMQFALGNGEPIGSTLTDAVAGAVPVAQGPGNGWGSSVSVAAGNPVQALTVGLNHITFGAAAPTAGAWAKGDICYNTNTSATGIPYWQCTTAGSPGTWTASPIL